MMDVSALEHRYHDRRGLEGVDDRADDAGGGLQPGRIGCPERRQQVEMADVGVGDAGHRPGGVCFGRPAGRQARGLVGGQVDDARHAAEATVACPDAAGRDHAVVLVRRQDQQPARSIPGLPAFQDAQSQQRQAAQGEQHRIEAGGSGRDQPGHAREERGGNPGEGSREAEEKDDDRWPEVDSQLHLKERIVEASDWSSSVRGS